MFNLELVKVAQEARAAFQASSDAWNEMNEMFNDIANVEVLFSSVYESKKDEWFSSFERGMELDTFIKGYFRSLKWRAA